MKLAKIVIEVSGKKIEFTPEEAKELKMILADMFGGERTVYVNQYPNHGWNWPWYWSGKTWCYNGSSLGSNLQGGTMNCQNQQAQGTLSGCSYSGQNWNASLIDNTVTLTAN